MAQRFYEITISDDPRNVPGVVSYTRLFEVEASIRVRSRIVESIEVDHVREDGVGNDSPTVLTFAQDPTTGTEYGPAFRDRLKAEIALQIEDDADELRDLESEDDQASLEAYFDDRISARKEGF